jgi:hypothetical protein
LDKAQKDSVAKVKTAMALKVKEKMVDKLTDQLDALK